MKLVTDLYCRAGTGDAVCYAFGAVASSTFDASRGVLVADDRSMRTGAMLKILKRWLGLERKPSREPPAGFGDPRRAMRQASSAKNAIRPGAPKKPGPAKPRRPVDVLDNPRLSLERPDEGFDPYNTGAFNRGQSWERIGKKKR